MHHVRRTTHAFRVAWIASVLGVRLQGGAEFKAAPADDLVSAGLKAGIYLEHGCRNGRCNSCRGRLVSGETEVIRAQLGLSAEDAKQGYILTCCHRAKTNLVLDASALDVPPIPSATRPCKIDALTVSGSVAQLTVRLPPSERVSFYPGQYAQLARGTSALRDYSIANSPRADGKLEFHIRRQTRGLFSDYVFGEAKAGDMLKLVGPRGSFFYRTAKPAKHVIFLATGTGLAPCKAILEQFAADVTKPRECWLYWGNRTAGDFYWRSPAESPLKLHFVPVASREAGPWSGLRGHVQDAALRDFPDCADLAVYACGSRAMIEGARAALTARGLPRDRFFSDAFVASN